MYKDLIGKEIKVLVTARSEHYFEYKGVLVSEDEYTIILKNAIHTYGEAAVRIGKKQPETIIINKEYIMSVHY